MGKLVVFEIGDGNLEQGFPVTLRITEEGKQILKHSRRIPSAVEICQHCDNWRNAYYNLATIRNARIPRIDIPDEQITNVSMEYREDDIPDEQRLQNYQVAAENFQCKMQEWLNQPEFLNLRIQVLQQVNSQEKTRIIIATNNRKLWRLPWHLWDLFNSDCDSEPAVSTEDCVFTSITSLINPVRILAIFGNSAGIDLKPDRKLLAGLEKQGARITWLTNPTRTQLKDQLSGHPWDILFFAGHSYSDTQGNNGVIQLNQSDRISLWELQNRFKEAVRKGLKLAIFNSCDGLGLAQNLAEVNLPHVIVMREPVPDRVAQKFLEHFLDKFSQGESLNQSVRHARLRLQEDETEYELPYANWLPVVYENPTVPPLIWEQSKLPPPDISESTSSKNDEDYLIRLIKNLVINLPKWAKLPFAFLIIFFSLILLVIVYNTISYPSANKQAKNFSNVENIISIPVAERISEGGKTLVSKTAEKIEGVTAFNKKNFALAAEKFAASLNKQKNDPESLIYLNNAKIGNQPALIIAVSVPIGSNVYVAPEILRGVAQVQNEINKNGGINGKLLKVVIANDENKEDIAKQIADTFVKDDKIIAVVGHNASDASVAAAPIYNRGGLVMITPTSFSDKLSSSGEYIFRMVPTIRVFTDTLSKYAIKTANKTKVAICSSKLAIDNESFSNQFVNSFREEGGTYIRVNCDFDEANFNPEVILERIKQKGADSLLLAPHVDRIDRAVNMAQANKGRLSLFASPTLYTNITLEKGQEAVNGLIVVTPWASEQLSSNHPFLLEAGQLWGGKVNWRTAEAYDATKLIATALKQNPTREGLKETISSSSFSVEGVTGKIEFWSGDRQFVRGSAIVAKVQPKTSGGYEFVLLPR